MPHDSRQAQQAHAAAVLAEAVAAHGVGALNDAAGVRSVLNDLLGTDSTGLRREVTLLAAAAAEGIPGVLLGGYRGGHEALTSRLVGVGYDREGAAWAVASWAAGIAIGMPPGREPATARSPEHLPAFERFGADKPISESDTNDSRRKLLVPLVAAALAVVAVGAVGLATIGRGGEKEGGEPPPPIPPPATIASGSDEGGSEPPPPIPPVVPIPTVADLAAALPSTLKVVGTTHGRGKLEVVDQNLCPDVPEAATPPTAVRFIYGSQAEAPSRSGVLGLFAWSARGGAVEYVESMRRGVQSCVAKGVFETESAESTTRTCQFSSLGGGQDVFFNIRCGTYDSRSILLLEEEFGVRAAQEGNVVGVVTLVLKNIPNQSGEQNFVSEQIEMLRAAARRLSGT